ncbi:MAG: NINE protein [Gemmataceae bacterium]|nr:NINE protein [Gemmataceae bacterium]
MRSTTGAYLLWLLIFVGFGGIHRIYAGKLWTGLLWLFTGGLFLVGQIIDLFLIPSMVENANLKQRLAAKP